MNSIQPLQGGAPPAGMPRNMTLTADQVDQVSSILSQYDPNSLTDEDTEAIRQAFREAKIGPGQDLRQAIEEAGFDAETIRGADKTQGAGPPPPPPQEEQSLSALSQLKEILSQYDLSDLDTDGQASLIAQLQETGLLQSGLYINISA